jgi:hypothetical protein
MVAVEVRRAGREASRDALEDASVTGREGQRSRAIPRIERVAELL